MSRHAILFACLTTALCGPAFAATPPDTASAPVAQTVLARTDAAEPRGSAQRPLSADEMADVHAGTDSKVTVLTNQQVTGTTSGNTITAGTLSSGAIGFSPNALNGYSGVGNFVINTGANNTLQGSINISIVTAPAP